MLLCHSVMISSIHLTVVTRFLIIIGLILLGISVSACIQAGSEEPPQVAAPTIAATPTNAPTIQPTDTPTSTPTASSTDVPTSTPTLTPTPTTTPTSAPTPGPTPDGVVRTARVPILMYHYISEPPADAHPYRVGNSLSPETFAAHLDFLQAEGFTTIPLKDFISYLSTGSPELPDKPIILSFDDGYEDNFLNAFPALAERGMMGTFFIITDFADQAETDEIYKNYANWEQLAEMADGGMEIGAHSRNHPNLAGKDLDYLVWQALGSKEAIEANIGAHPHILSYPAGSYDQLVIDVFRSAHFWGAVITQQGVVHSSDGDNPFKLRRVRISNTTGVPQLEALLNYDWPSDAQAAN